MPSWVQDSETGKLIPKDEYYGRQSDTAPFIQGDIESFVSPVDGTLIDDRAKLRRHNAKHGVTDSRDYSPEFMAQRGRERDDRMMGNTKEAKAERIEILKRATEGYRS